MAGVAFPLLSALVWLPALAAPLARHWARGEDGAYRVALAAVLLDLAIVACLIWRFDAARGGPQFAERWDGAWCDYHLAVDGVALLFLPLSVGIALLALLCGRDGANPPPRAYSAAVPAYLAALLGLFTCQDLLLFWLFSALESAVALWMLWRWRAGDAGAAVLRCGQFLLGALLLQLAATVLLGWQQAETAGHWSFDLADLAAQPAPPAVQAAALFLLLFAFAIRLPLFPLHGWLAPVLQHAGPLAVAPIFLVGLKTGVYGWLRWVLPLLPDAAYQWSGVLAPVALAGIFYGAVLALAQLQLARLLAYAVVSHGSVVFLGLLTLDREGLAGALLMAIDAGIAGAGLLLACRMIQRRTGTLLLPRLGDVFDRLPAVGLMFLIAASTLMGMPGTPGFDAAHLLLEGTLKTHAWAITVAVAGGNVLTAAVLLWAFQRVFLARRRCLRHLARQPATLPESIAAGALSLALLAGFYTSPWLEVIEPGLAGLLRIHAK